MFASHANRDGRDGEADTNAGPLDEAGCPTTREDPVVDTEWGRVGGPTKIAGPDNSAVGIRLDGSVIHWGVLEDTDPFPDDHGSLGVGCGPTQCSLLRKNGAIWHQFHRFEVVGSERFAQMSPIDGQGAALSATGRARRWLVTEARYVEDEYGRATPEIVRAGNDDPIDSPDGGIGTADAGIDGADPEPAIGGSFRPKGHPNLNPVMGNAVLDLALAVPGTRFSAISGEGCAIRESDKALVFLPPFAAHYRGEVEVREGPPGEFATIVDCHRQTNPNLPAAGQLIGLLLTPDGKLVSFDENTTTPHEALTRTYVQVVAAVGFVCGILKSNGMLDCDGTYFNIDPPLDVVFQSLATEHATNAGAGRMYGITPDLKIHYWGDGGGTAMAPPPGFPYL